MAAARTLGFWETTSKIYHDANRCSGMLFQMASLRGPWSERLLRRTLRALQDKRPLLRATIQDHDGRSFELVVGERAETGLPLRTVPRRNERTWESVVDVELAVDFPSSAPCLWRAVFVEGGAEDHEVVFVLHGAISDSRASHELVEDVLEVAAALHEGADDLGAGREHDLLPTVEELLPNSPETAESLRYEEDNFFNPELRAWPFDEYATLGDRRSVHRYNVVSEASLERLEARTRAEGVDLHAFLLGVLVRATYCGPWSQGIVLSSPTVDLRPYCGGSRIPSRYLGSFFKVLHPIHHVGSGGGLWDAGRDAMRERDREIDEKSTRGFSPRRFSAKQLATEHKIRTRASNRAKYFPAGPLFIHVDGVRPLRRAGQLEVTGVHFGTAQVSGVFSAALHTVVAGRKLHMSFTTPHPLVSSERAQAAFDALVSALEEGSVDGRRQNDERA